MTSDPTQRCEHGRVPLLDGPCVDCAREVPPPKTWQDEFIEAMADTERARRRDEKRT